MSRTTCRTAARRLARPLPVRVRVALLVAFLPAVVLAAFADYGQTWDAAVAVLSAGAAVWAGTTAVSLLARYADRRTREESS